MTVGTVTVNGGVRWDFRRRAATSEGPQADTLQRPSTMNQTQIHIGMLPIRSPDMSVEALEKFARRAAADVQPIMESATGASWSFHMEAPSRLSSDDPRRAADFLQEASLRMAEGPYDAILVITNVPVVSRKNRVVPGLASTIGRVMVLSTRKHQASPRGEPRYELDSDPVRLNAAALVLHLTGHILGLGHVRAPEDAVMAPFSFDPARAELPSFCPESRERLPGLASEFPGQEYSGQGTLSELAFHLSSAARHPRQTLLPLVRSRAPFLPLHLPRLATAALVPTFILVFTAEIWDAGFHMTAPAVAMFSVFSVLASTVYLVTAQNLFLPHEEKRFHTEHLAVVNVGIVFTILVAITGLFLMLGLLMLVIQVYIFPPDLVREWPSLQLDRATITLVDQVRIAGLISTIGVLTGALGGGLESRDLIRHLALFGSDP